MDKSNWFLEDLLSVIEFLPTHFPFLNGFLTFDISFAYRSNDGYIGLQMRIAANFPNRGLTLQHRFIDWPKECEGKMNDWRRYKRK